MTNIDQAIRDALSIQDAKALEGLGADQPLFRQVMDMFTGKLAWLNVIVWIAGFAAFAAAVYCGWRFVAAPELREMAIWGGACALAVLMLVSIKMWSWMEISKHALLREIKRLELQLALTRQGGA